MSEAPPERPTLKARLENASTTIVIFLLIFMMAVVYFAPTMFIFIKPGETGVLWKRFGGGTVTGGPEGFVAEIEATPEGVPTTPGEGTPYPYTEGFHLIFPWDKMFIYDLRLQQHFETLDVLSKDGLRMMVGLTVRWKIIESDVGKLHKMVGPEYVETLLIPTVGSYARARLAEASPDGIYSQSRLALQESIRQSVQDDLRHRFFPEMSRESMIIVEDVLIRDISLPQLVQDAIEEKLQELHRAEAMNYRLAGARIEAERKQVEAQGIQAFQTTIDGGISPNYLRWKGIEATLELAASPNAKVVVIGDQDGLPLILGGLEQAPKTP